MSTDRKIYRQTGTHRPFKVGRLAHTDLSKSADWNTPNFQSRQTGTHRPFKVGRLAHTDLSESADWHTPNFQSRQNGTRQTGTQKRSADWKLDKLASSHKTNKQTNKKDKKKSQTRTLTASAVSTQLSCIVQVRILRYGKRLYGMMPSTPPINLNRGWFSDETQGDYSVSPSINIGG